MYRQGQPYMEKELRPLDIPEINELTINSIYIPPPRSHQRGTLLLYYFTSVCTQDVTEDQLICS